MPEVSRTIPTSTPEPESGSTARWLSNRFAHAVAALVAWEYHGQRRDAYEALRRLHSVVDDMLEVQSGLFDELTADEERAVGITYEWCDSCRSGHLAGGVR